VVSFVRETLPLYWLRVRTNWRKCECCWCMALIATRKITWYDFRGSELFEFSLICRETQRSLGLVAMATSHLRNWYYNRLGLPFWTRRINSYGLFFFGILIWFLEWIAAPMGVRWWLSRISQIITSTQSRFECLQ
jgi:hypothetical protein